MGALDLITYVLQCPLPLHIFRFSFTLPCVCIIKFMFVRLANKYYYYYCSLTLYLSCQPSLLPCLTYYPSPSPKPNLLLILYPTLRYLSAMDTWSFFPSRYNLADSLTPPRYHCFSHRLFLPNVYLSTPVGDAVSNLVSSNIKSLQCFLRILLSLAPLAVFSLV